MLHCVAPKKQYALGLQQLPRTLLMLGVQEPLSGAHACANRGGGDKKAKNTITTVGERNNIFFICFQRRGRAENCQQ